MQHIDAAHRCGFDRLGILVVDMAASCYSSSIKRAFGEAGAEADKS